MRKLKHIVAMTLLVMATGLFSVSAAGFADVPERHYAKAAIENLSAAGLVKGVGDNLYEPDRPVKRAEFAALINSAFGFSAASEIGFTDVSADAWYADDIAIAVGTGYMSGYGDGTVKPEAAIQRQQAAVAIYRILGEPEGELVFNDRNAIADYAEKAVGALAANGIINGFPDGSFRPADSITRAQAAMIVANMLAALDEVEEPVQENGGIILNETSLSDGIVEGNLTITLPGTVVENVTVTGNLIIAKSVGDGDVTLKNVKVIGDFLVLGGGENSVECLDCEFGKVYVSNENGKVRVIIEGGSAAEVIFTADGKLEIKGEGAVESVVLSESLGKDTKISIEGDVNKITIDAPAELSVAGSVGSIDMLAAGSLKLEGGSEVGKLNITENAAGARVDIPKDATVAEAVIDAKSSFTGTGAPETASINAAGVTAQTAPKELAEGSQKTEAPSTGGGGAIKPPAVTPPAVTTPAPGSVMIAAGPGIAGDGEITGLESDKFYKLMTGETTLYVTADGSTSADITNIGRPADGKATGLTNGATYTVVEATPLSTGYKVYKYTDASTSEQVGGDSISTDGLISVTAASVNEGGVGIFAIYANLDAVLGVSSDTNKFRGVRINDPDGSPGAKELVAVAIENEAGADTTWKPYASVGVLSQSQAYTRPQIEAVSDYLAIWRYSDDYVIDDLQARTELNVSESAHTRAYIFDSHDGNALYFLRVAVS